MKLILCAILFLFTWALIHGGTRKEMPPVTQHNENNPDHMAGV